jgi:trimethylamine--corrinoid protein Co-methyltransferase
MNSESKRRREGGRMRRIVDGVLPQLPWRDVRNPYPPLEMLSADQVEAIHRTSLRILSELGIELMSSQARALMRAYGAETDETTGNVRIDEALVERALRTAPATFTLTPRNPEHAVTLGGNHLVFGLVAGPPNVHDFARGRRAGNLRDYRDFIRLAQHFNAVHVIGNQVCAPIELPANTRHLDTYLANLT